MNVLTVVHQDDDLVVIDKPPGWLVHRSNLDRHESRIVVQALRDQIGRRVHPVHRLDKGTSGVLLFALNPESARKLGDQFTRHQVGKTYHAIVRGWPPEARRIDHPLRELDDDYDDAAGGGEAREAVTDYRRLASFELPYRVDRYPTSRYALLELNPVTGRRHQLRRHLKHISHPIVGDATYGKGRHNRLFQAEFGCYRLLLACVELAFEHPASGERMAVSIPVTDQFAGVIEQLRPWSGPGAAPCGIIRPSPSPSSTCEKYSSPGLS